MRFNCVAKGENCLVDVEPLGKTWKVVVFAGKSGGPKIAEFDVKVQAFPNPDPTSTALHEQAARIGLGSFEATASDNWKARKEEPFVGVLTLL